MLPIYVLYGTETNNSADLAESTANAIEAIDLPVTVLDMEDFDPEHLEDLHTLLVITSTFGAGEPPGNAEELHAFVHEEALDLSELNFSVCGLGDTTYEDFCQCAKDFDERLGAHGGTRFVPRVDCDVDFEPPWEAWLEQVLAALAEMEFPEADEGFVEAVESREERVSPVGSRKNPFMATVLANENLNAPGSAKETRHVSLSLVGSGLAYKPGDSLGMFPRNCPDLVRRILTPLGIDRDAPVEVEGMYRTIRWVMIHQKDVNTIDKRLLELGMHSSGWQLASQLLADSDARRAYAEQNHVIDFVQQAELKAEPQAFIDSLKALGPRLYSISSSPLMHPGEVHLCVDVLRYELHGSGRKGVASTFLAERCGAEIEVPVYLRATNDFVICADEVPMILIGPGTGVAPMRAFLEDRAARAITNGYAWLFFGARHEATDFLYRDELHHYLESGILTRLDTAFSRDQAEKIYVQDRIWEHGADFWAWLEAGAVIYICGDATYMAKDVHAVLHRVVEHYGGMSEAEAADYVKQLSADHRYLRDVY